MNPRIAPEALRESRLIRLNFHFQMNRVTALQKCILRGGISTHTVANNMAELEGGKLLIGFSLNRVKEIEGSQSLGAFLATSLKGDKFKIRQVRGWMKLAKQSEESTNNALPDKPPSETKKPLCSVELQSGYGQSEILSYNRERQQSTIKAEVCIA